MYLEFVKTYTPIFEYKKNKNKHSRYTWHDEDYNCFMMAIL